jgi:hypothetical protein
MSPFPMDGLEDCGKFSYYFSNSVEFCIFCCYPFNENGIIEPKANAPSMYFWIQPVCTLTCNIVSSRSIVLSLLNRRHWKRLLSNVRRHSLHLPRRQRLAVGLVNINLSTFSAGVLYFEYVLEILQKNMGTLFPCSMYICIYTTVSTGAGF